MFKSSLNNFESYKYRLLEGVFFKHCLGAWDGIFYRVADRNAACCFVKSTVLWHCGLALNIPSQFDSDNQIHLALKNLELLDECLVLGMVPVFKVVGGEMLLAALWRALFSGALPGSEHSSICNNYDPLNKQNVIVYT